MKKNKDAVPLLELKVNTIIFNSHQYHLTTYDLQ